ncbi:MAG: ABC transporter permease [Lachnospiraceae bacterium]|nr:ABC transporter permease [Lachnospiraceae bacterium]
MFFNLAWRNAKRSRNENVIYFLTLVTAVASFYIVLSLGQQDVIRFLGEIERDAVRRLLTAFMPTVYFCALLLLFFLVIFANKYQMKCRSRELGLYLIFGMKKKRLFAQVMTESLFSSLIALCGGIVIGGFLSEIISLATARLVGQGVIAHKSSISLSGIIWTLIGFLSIQVTAHLILSAKLFKKELFQLLYGEVEKKQNVGNIRGGFLSLILGVIALLTAYWIAINWFIKLQGAMLFVAVLFGIAGTVLFVRGLARLISIFAGLAKRKSTNGLYTFTLRQFQENIANKYISVSVASVLIMLAIMLVADGSANIISNRSNLTRGAAVYDFTVTGENKAAEAFLTSDIMKPYVENLNQMEVGNIKRPSANSDTSFIDWTRFIAELEKQLTAEEQAQVKDAQYYEISDDNSAAFNLYGTIITNPSPALISVSSYNRLLTAAGETTLELSDNEAVFYLNPDFLGDARAAEMLNYMIKTYQTDGNALVFLDKKPLYLIPNVSAKGITADENIRIYTAFIVSDDLFEKYVNPDTATTYWDFCLPEKLVESDGLMRSIMDVNEILKPSGLFYESYLNNFGRQLFYIISGSYTTLYMGFMFLIIACALLTLQFLTQMQATKNRYLTLSMLGAKRGQMKKSMHKQVLWFFLLPILLACVSGTVGLYVIQVNLHTNTTDGAKLYPLLFVMAGIVILVLSIYAIAVARTADREIAKLNCKPVM